MVTDQPCRSALQAAALGSIPSLRAVPPETPCMCRFLAYVGEPIFLADLVCAPTHSLIHQSMHADEGKTPTNGDGFGLGWYAEREEPGLHREIRPAWSDENLRSLCE
jgi:glutamine amidotransferase